MSDAAAPIAAGGIKRLAKNTAVYATADLIAKGGAYLLMPVLTRLLTGVEFGRYTLVISIVPVLTLIASLGLGGAVTRLWFDLDAGARKRFQLSAWLGLQGAALGLALLLTMLSGPLFRTLFPGAPPHIFLYGIWSSFFLAAATVPLAVLRAEEKPKRFAALSGSQFLFPAAAMLVALTTGSSLDGVLKASLIGSAAVFALAVAMMAPLAARPADWTMLRPALALGLPVVPHLVAHWALNVVDRVAIQREMGAAAVGLYAVGYQIAQGVSLIATAINNATVPSFYRAAGRGRRDALGRAWTPMLYVLGAFSLGVSLLGPELVSLLAKESYRATAAFIPWVALGYWLLAAYYFPVNALFYAKRVRMIPVATIAAAIANYTLNTLMLPRYGLIAAAWNTAISYGILLAIVLVAAQRVWPLPYRFLRTIAIGALGAGVYALSTLLPDGTAGTVLKAPLFGVYAIGGWLIARSEIAALRALPQIPAEGGGSRRVVLAAATTTQARTMVACAPALRAAGFEPAFVGLDPLIGKNAAYGFDEAGVDYTLHGTPRATRRGRMLHIVFGGRTDARSLVDGAAAVVIGNDFTPLERLIVQEARRAGVASVLMQDGVIALTGEQEGGGARSGSAPITLAKRALSLLGLPFAPRPYGMGGCDAICVYGPSTADALVRRGVRGEAIHVTGQPRYDAIGPAEPKPAARRDGPILVTTQPFSRYGLASAADETALFAQMIDAAAGRGSVIVKLHPDTDANSRDALRTAAPAGARFEQQIPIEALLAEARLVVTLSSTTALEAMLHGVPVVVVDAPGFPTTLPYVDSEAVEAARDPARMGEGIGEAIDRALAGDLRVAHRRRFLAAHLAPLDGRAGVRVAAAVLAAVATKHESL
ncbi:MAG TPA: oligosaccharide flippase family protein [Actinomycetota bacterium]